VFASFICLYIEIDNKLVNLGYEKVFDDDSFGYRENKLLKQERDILKKATAYFAKETL